MDGECVGKLCLLGAEVFSRTKIGVKEKIKLGITKGKGDRRSRISLRVSPYPENLIVPFLICHKPIHGKSSTGALSFQL